MASADDDPSLTRTWNSPVYAEIRPRYPPSLFQLLANLTPTHELAWDAGTGNGQAALSLAEHFERVIATDISEKQLSCAFPHPNVTYARMNAEAPIEEVESIVGKEGSVDLVIVATALHWFNLDNFFPLVHHVLRKPGGVFAAWSYYEPSASPEVDAELERQGKQAQLLGFSDPRSLIAESKYASIAFPFDPVLPNTVGTEPVHFTDVVKHWNFDQYLQFLRSTSSAKKALEKGIDLFEGENLEKLREAWGPLERVLPVTFSIWMRVGKVPST